MLLRKAAHSPARADLQASALREEQRDGLEVTVRPSLQS